jgi:aminomethyltransferase
MSDLKRTPLRDFHAAHGGRLVDFAGWEMPVQYRSILEEHKAVRRMAGLFDVSHMGEVDVRGPQAGTFLNYLVTNDVAKLHPGRVLYSPMCYPSGGVVDDLLVYMHGPEDYFLCINAGNIDKDLAWIHQQAAAFKVTVTDRSADYAQLAVQGPKAAAIVQSLTGAKLATVKYYHFVEGTVAGVHCLISRTGYTGEDGFELYHAAGDATELAAALLKAGQPHGMELAGLGARDSLRLEAGYPLYGHEITQDISPLTRGFRHAVSSSQRGDRIGLGDSRGGGPTARRGYSRRKAQFASRQTSLCGTKKIPMSNVPSDLRYAKSHEWVKLAGDGTATVGITDYAQNSLGDITYVQMPKPGATLTAGQVFGVVESVKAASDLYAPVGGTVIETNPTLESAPETVNQQPYEGGWMLKLKLSNPAEAAALNDAAAYGKLIS